MVSEKYRYLGTTGVSVSPLCLGTMTFGREADEAMSGSIYRASREAGINFFDCANVYSLGKAESILGRLVESERDDVVITTKVGGKWGDDPNARGCSRRHIIRSVEGSLRRLRTDYIDVYFLHHFDPHARLEEAIGALDHLIRAGKIRYAGVSNFAAWQVMKSLGIEDARGWNRVQCLQPMYSLAKRQAEVEILPLAESEKLGVITYSPLGGGLLTGKYHGEAASEDGRLRVSEVYGKRYAGEANEDLARRFSEFARSGGYAPASLAVAWVAHHPVVTAPIIGARNLEQLGESLGALDIEMSTGLYDQVSALSPSPPPATDRSEVDTRSRIS